MNTTWVSLTNAGQYNQTQVGNALASSVAATDITAGANNAGQALTFPAGYLQAGMAFRVRAAGILSNTATPNLTLGVYWGGVAGTALATTGAITTASSLSNNIWRLGADVRVESVGATGGARTIGAVDGIASTTSYLPATSSSGGLVTIDTSAAKILTIGATWGTSSGSNTITCHLFVVERLNEGAS